MTEMESTERDMTEKEEQEDDIPEAKSEQARESLIRRIASREEIGDGTSSPLPDDKPSPYPD